MLITNYSNEDLVAAFLRAHKSGICEVAMRWFKEELMRRLEIAEASARDVDTDKCSPIQQTAPKGK